MEGFLLAPNSHSLITVFNVSQDRIGNLQAHWRRRGNESGINRGNDGFDSDGARWAIKMVACGGRHRLSFLRFKRREVFHFPPFFVRIPSPFRSGTLSGRIWAFAFCFLADASFLLISATISALELRNLSRVSSTLLCDEPVWVSLYKEVKHSVLMLRLIERGGVWGAKP